MQTLLILAVLASKLDDPTPPSASIRAEGSHKIDDPFSRRILPASMIRVSEPERKPEPPAEPPPAPKADMPPVCPCVLNAGVCSCAAEAKEGEPPKPASTFTPGVVHQPKAPVDEWHPFTANPAYEVLGHEDETGTFRYTTSRLKAGHAAPSPTYAAPAYQGYSAGSACAGGSCAQPQAQGFNLFRGFRSR